MSLQFWWSNVLQSEIDTFPSEGQLYGYSPFREVQLVCISAVEKNSHGGPC